MQKLQTDNPELFTFQSEPLSIDILGGIKLSGLDRLRVTLRISKTNDHSFPLRNSLDLYQSDQTEKLIQQTSNYFSIDSSQVRNIINELISQLEEYRFQSLEHLYNNKQKEVELTNEQRSEAMSFLKNKNLLALTGEMIGDIGVVGEENNRLLLFLIYTSRLTSNPLHAIILGSSGEGKTHLQEKVSSLIPQEQIISITALTENALYYFDHSELNNKIITIEDLDGVESALYPIRELQSKHQLSKTYTQRDSKGNMRTITHVVEGKVVISGCTTRESVYEDNSNRSILIHVDSSKEQDEKILKYHQEKYGGENNLQEEKQIQSLFQNVQRTLKPVNVINPFASKLSLPSFISKPRRTMALYLSLIETITLYHQYQRKIKKINGVPTIETKLDDVIWANRLLRDCLLEKSDHLTYGCRTFFEAVKKYLKENGTEKFYQRDIRGITNYRPSTQHKYLKELVQEGFLSITDGKRNTGYLYQLNGFDNYLEIEKEVNTIGNNL